VCTPERVAFSMFCVNDERISPAYQQFDIRKFENTGPKEVSIAATSVTAGIFFFFSLVDDHASAE
jgi:hypothetical protein